MSGETKQAEQPNEWTNGQTGGWTSRQSGQNRWTAGGTAERMDKRTNGRMDEQTERTEQMDSRRNSRTNGQTDGWTSGQSRQNRTEQTEQTEQDEQAERRSRQAKQTDCRHLAPPFGRFAKHRTESCRRRKKRQSAPEKPDGSGNREQIGRKWRPGADRTKADRPKRRYGISGRLFRYVRRR